MKLGPAPSRRDRPLDVSVVTVAELLEGADDDATTLAALRHYRIQGIRLTQARRMGENDAGLVATAESIDARKMMEALAGR